MEFKTLLKNTSFLAGSRMVAFLTGLVRIKLIAYFLGTLGAGLVSQLTFVTQRMSQFTLLSMREALVKQIAESKESPKSIQLINSVYKMYSFLIGSFMFISCTALYFLSEYLTIYVFGDISYISYFYISLFSFPLLILDSIPFSILKAYKDVKTIAKARVIVVLINLLIAVPLFFKFKLDGAIAYVPLSYLVSFIMNFYFARKFYFKKLKVSFISILQAETNIKFMKEMLLFSTFGLTVGLFSIISEFVCRSIVISILGVDSIGLYSPIIMWASMVTGFILPSFSTYLYPRFCEIKSNKEISSLLNDGIRLGTFVLMPLLLIGVPYKDFFISLFYSDEFLGASKYLPFHFLGVVFYVWWYVFSQSMTPTGRIKQHGILLTIYFALDMVVTYFFVLEIGLYGWMLKHVISPFIFFWIYYMYSKKQMGFCLDIKNSILMTYLLASSCILIVIDFSFKDYSFVNLLLGPSLIMLSFILLKKEEKDYLLCKLNFIFKNKS